jgi:hypothetical protein
MRSSDTGVVWLAVAASVLAGCGGGGGGNPHDVRQPRRSASDARIADESPGVIGLTVIARRWVPVFGFSPVPSP